MSNICNVAITNPVGAKNNIAYWPNWYAVTTTNLGISTVSAKGAKIGIDKTANPEEDGTMNPNTK
jgi:hypothetical protein